MDTSAVGRGMYPSCVSRPRRNPCEGSTTFARVEGRVILFRTLSRDARAVARTSAAQERQHNQDEHEQQADEQEAQEKEIVAQTVQPCTRQRRRGRRGQGRQGWLYGGRQYGAGGWSGRRDDGRERQRGWTGCGDDDCWCDGRRGGHYRAFTLAPNLYAQPLSALAEYVGLVGSVRSVRIRLQFLDIDIRELNRIAMML